MGMGRSSNEELRHVVVDVCRFASCTYFTLQMAVTPARRLPATVTTVSPLAVTQNLAFGRLFAKVASVSG